MEIIHFIAKYMEWWLVGFLSCAAVLIALFVFWCFFSALAGKSANLKEPKVPLVKIGILTLIFAVLLFIAWFFRSI